jgi:hypothetical protein
VLSRQPLWNRFGHIRYSLEVPLLAVAEGFWSLVEL